MKSKPAHWEINVEHLVKQKGLGDRRQEKRDAIYASIEELIKVGLVVKNQERIGGKFGKIHYDFYDFPQNPPLTELPDTVLPDTVLPDTGRTMHSKYSNQQKRNLEITEGRQGNKWKEFEPWVREKIRDRPDVRAPEKLIAHILALGESSPEWQEFAQDTRDDTDLYESIYEELTNV